MLTVRAIECHLEHYFLYETHRWLQGLGASNWAEPERLSNGPGEGGGELDI